MWRGMTGNRINRVHMYLGKARRPSALYSRLLDRDPFNCSLSAM